jgi:hypothetical protein
LAGEAGKLAGAGKDSPAFKRTGHMDATTAPELQDALVAEEAERAKDGVRIHAEHGRQFASWG